MEPPPSSDDSGTGEPSDWSLRFLDTPGDIQIDPATLPENIALMRKLDEQISNAPSMEYELVIRDQAGARNLLEATGALFEIESAVIACAKATWPTPKYSPQAIKRLLGKRGWRPEVRVPPLDVEYDDLPVNDRYDLYKVFDCDGSRIGVAIEIERWAVWTDLLKFRRGIDRGQIAAGVLIHDNPAHLKYVFEHLRLMAHPLFADVPVLFAAPAGHGLEDSYKPSTKKFQPYLMPESWNG